MTDLLPAENKHVKSRTVPDINCVYLFTEEHFENKPAFEE